MVVIDPTLYEYPPASTALLLDSDIAPLDRSASSASSPSPSSSASFFLSKFLPFASKHRHYHHQESSLIPESTNHSGAPSICTASDGGFASCSAFDTDKPLINSAHPLTTSSSKRRIKAHTEDNHSTVSSDDEHNSHHSPVSSFRRRASRYLFRSRHRHQHHHQPNNSSRTFSSCPNTFHEGSSVMDQEEAEEAVSSHHVHLVTLPSNNNNEENSSSSSIDEPAESAWPFYRLDDRFARCLNECDPVMLPRLRRKRIDTPIIISEQEDDEDELKNDHDDDGNQWQLLLLQSLQVETNAMLKASLYTSCTNRRMVMLGPKSTTATESIPFVVQHIGHYQQQPYHFSYPSK